jgi:hypothetical protein
MEEDDAVVEDTVAVARRWGDRAWDIAIRVMGVALLAICGYFFSRLSDAEAKIHGLEVKAAVNDSEKAQILMTLGEIKTDVKAIKAKVGVP